MVCEPGTDQSPSLIGKVYTCVNDHWVEDKKRNNARLSRTAPSTLIL